MLTFRSSSPETKVFIDREPDGRQRVCRATREHGERQWKLSLEHPDGTRWSGSFSGDKAELPLAMVRMLADRENEFVQGRARGDRPPQPAFEYNRPIHVPPIGGTIRRVRG
jgi:hypothetical protein